MSIDQLTCLIVGETPSIQFIAWRLSLGNVFIILISQYVSIDGLISWKSTRLGANFFTPNIFAKTIEELTDKTPFKNDIKTKKYKLDIVVITGSSLDSFTKNCLELKPYCDQNTIIIVSSDYGVELETVALSIFKNCKFVTTIYCEVECRQLSLGSFALINDEDCFFYVGKTVADEFPLSTASTFEMTLNPRTDIYEDSTLQKMCEIFTESKWVIVEFVKDPKRMSVIVWKHIIPKISLNILSIIYDKFDYNDLLKSKSTKIIFEDIVNELLTISYRQCETRIDLYYNSSKDEIKYTNIIQFANKKRQELINSTSNEYPEYLSLPFELYCFYHKFEFPAHILLYQPIILGMKYKVPYSNLNFLYGFYSQLLNLNGFSILGGHCEQKASFFFNLKGRLDLETDKGHSHSKSHYKTKKKKKDRKGHKSSTNLHDKNIEYSKKTKQQKTKQSSLTNSSIGASNMSLNPGTNNFLPNDSIFSPGLEDLILNSGNILNSTNVASTNIYTATIDKVTSNFEELGFESLTESSTETTSSDSDDYENGNMLNKGRKKNPVYRSNSCSSDGSSGVILLENNSFNHRYKKYSESLVDFFETPKLFKKFKTRTSNNNSSYNLNNRSNSEVTFSNPRPHTTSCLEFTNNDKSNMISKEFLDLRQQMFKLEIQSDTVDIKDKRKKYIQLELKLWKLQRRFHEYNGTIKKNEIKPLEELLDHIEILNKGNTGDILNWTTCRYGDVDFYKNIQQDKEKILTLFNESVRDKD